jgi:hypothetical protein
VATTHVSVDNREHRAAADAREWQLLLATVAGCVLVCWRLVGAVLQFQSEDGGFGLALAYVVEALVCGVLIAFLRARRRSAGVALFLIWLLGFLYSWYASGAILPPFALFSLLIGFGLFLGIQAVFGEPQAAPVDSDVDAV